MSATLSTAESSTQSSPNSVTPLSRFYHWEKTSPDRLYMSQPYGNGKIEDFTWGRTALEVRKMANYLRLLDLPPGSHIAILSKNCAHWIMSDLAIWMAGHVSVPLYPTLNAESIRQIMQHSGSKVLFVGKLDDWASQSAGIDNDVECISYPLSPHTDFSSWDSIVAKQEPISDSPEPELKQLATIMYTSGTTGMPKGVMHSFESLSFAAEQVGNIYKVSEDDRILSYLPLSHVAERICVELGSLYESLTIYFAESLDTFTQDLQRAQPTMFFAVPRIWIKFQMGVFNKIPEDRLKLLLRIPLVSTFIKNKLRDGLGLSKVRIAISGAAPISKGLLEWYEKLGITILEGYGMTENMGYSHTTRLGEALVGSVGRSNPGVMTTISESGEILVKSPATMVGYYKEPEKTAEVITTEGYLRTGDIGKIDAKGRLMITGRIKEIFKTSKGKYVTPAPIENRINESSHIEMCCVTGSGLPQPLVIGMMSPAALKLDQAVVRKELELMLQGLNSKLNAHERLAALVLVSTEWSTESGELTPTLKLKRNVIDETYGGQYEKWYDSKESVIFI